jgi:hypothetical protein
VCGWEVTLLKERGLETFKIKHTDDLIRVRERHSEFRTYARDQGEIPGFRANVLNVYRGAGSKGVACY